jgi:hypothetical protein
MMLSVASVRFAAITSLAWMAGDGPSRYRRYVAIHVALTGHPSRR